MNSLNGETISEGLMFLPLESYKEENWHKMFWQNPICWKTEFGEQYKLQVQETQ